MAQKRLPRMGLAKSRREFLKTQISRPYSGHKLSGEY